MFKPTKYSPTLTDAAKIVEFSKQTPKQQARLSSYTVNTGSLSYRSLFFDDAKVVDMRKRADSPVAIIRPGEYLVNTDALHVTKSISDNSMSCLTSNQQSVKKFDINTANGAEKACAISTQNSKFIAYQRALEHNNSQYLAIIMTASDSKNDQATMKQILESVEIL